METTTPMLKQYQEIKSKHPHSILFFRLGDFYEMFYDDAKTASPILDVVLTSRSNGKSSRIPMCGIPIHAADSYIAKLIKAGFKVSICEQLEDPSQAQGIVKRDVIRTITSGTFLDDSDDSRSLVCLKAEGPSWGLAFTQPTSGTIQTNQYADTLKAIEIISKLGISECLFAESQEALVRELFRHPLLRMKNIALTACPDWSFNPDLARKAVCDHFGVQHLKGFGIEGSPLSQAACGALLEYLREMNNQPLRHIDKISVYTDEDYVFISPAACHGLELEDLLKTIDHTLTALGKRELRHWLYHPLKDLAAIEKRQKAATLFKDNPSLRHEIEKLLRHFPDVERHISRLSCGYMSIKDILAIRQALTRLPFLKKALQDFSGESPFFLLEDIPDLRELLEKAVNPEIPLPANLRINRQAGLAHPEGKIIQKGYNAKLDSLREIQENGRQWLKSLQSQEIRRSGINSLKIGFNQVFGYYIEITKPNLSLVPADYIRKQTLVNGERFITPALKEFEEKILTAEEKILQLEDEILQELKNEILNHSASVHNFASSIAVLDSLYALSVLALSKNFCLPQITEETTIDIQDGRHPVVEKTSRESFIPNDTLLDCEENHLLILTGPNMAGKSTYIRQSALLVILAQMGSYIPARSARIGVVDKIFTRIGAHDEIAKGQSTFMVEMSEAADILNNLSHRSLIILDEIGRGTSTYDGLSLAWALAEHLQKQKVRTLFATHFHELTALAQQYPGVKNYNVAVKEWKDEIVFLHKIIPGSTDDSYGIYVAKLAGIPRDVIDRSRQILTRLELQNNLKERIQFKPAGGNQLSFFSSSADNVTLEKIKSIIQAMDINSLTPLAALNKMQELREILASDEK